SAAGKTGLASRFALPVGSATPADATVHRGTSDVLAPYNPAEGGIHAIGPRGPAIDRTTGLTRCTLPQSTLMPAAATVSDHFAFSEPMYDANCSGVLPTISLPAASSFCRTSGAWSACTATSCNRAMIAFGVPAGASSPYQAVASNPGKPNSATVGTSGKDAMRRDPVVATARSLPSLTCGSTTLSPNMSCTSPRRTSAIAGAAPL